MAETNPPAGPAPTRRRWGRVLLVASLALNLVFIGLIVGAVARGGGVASGARHLDRMSMGLGAYIEALPADARAIVKSAGGGFERDDRRARFRALHAQRKAIVEALEAEPFDAQALRAAVMTHRNSTLGSSIALQDAFLEAFVGLDAAERNRVLAEAQSIKRKWREKREKREKRRKER